MPVQSYRDLNAWKVAMELVVEIYAVTKRVPQGEMYGLSGQLRQAAVAIPSNVAEGHRQGGRTYLRHVGIALGSMGEAETQLVIARRLAYVAEQDLDRVVALAKDVRRLLFGLRRALRQKYAKKAPASDF